jgi:chaperonin GroES
MWKIKPLADRIVLKAIEKDNITDTGIYLPDSANKERPFLYEVIEIWPWTSEKDTSVLKIWDKVLVGQYSWDDVKIDEEEFKIVWIDYILAIVE